MNATESTTLPTLAEGEEETAPLTLDELIDQVDDGSRLVEGMTAEMIAEPIAKAAKAVKSAWTRVTNTYKVLAQEQANGRRNVLLPDGRPDWAGTSGTWKAIARATVDIAFVDLTKGERDKVTGAVRQHLNRTFLEIAIRAYVAESETASGEKIYPDEESMGSEAFLLAVRRQYKDAELAVPTRYQTPEDKAGGSGSGPGNGPKNLLTAAWSGVEGLKQVIPAMAAYVALRATSELVVRITTGEGEVKNRKQVAYLLSRTAGVAEFGAQYLDNAIEDHDKAMAEVKPLLWSEKDEKDAAKVGDA